MLGVQSACDTGADNNQAIYGGVTLEHSSLLDVR